ncbi:GFA family protein [Pelagibius sp. Alg239-R121]|uniref:GFA family protein n=1 Tax=Pelagibius sp. Alg239-R121 TaxID=2993448 RepID=UPI0024A77939|nr:GFA family protein [Pelagibius sp. Alg239-R121]
MTLYRGSCHCGEVRFEIEAEAEIRELVTCDCSLCRKKNALMTKVHESKFTLIAGEDKLSLYKWNTQVAQHFFCSVCGIYTFHRKRAQPDHYSVNASCLDDLTVEGLPVRATEGLDMTVVATTARPEWQGPRLSEIAEARIRMRGR